MVIVAFIFLKIIQLNVFMLTYIPSDSMSPTLPGPTEYNGQPMIQTVAIYRKTKNIEKGDIIIFKQDNKWITKRLIATPGDTVEIKNGFVYINDTILKEDYVSEQIDLNYVFSKQVVPENSYFVLGDNRNNSYDSREFENTYISDKQIYGSLCHYWILNIGSRKSAEKKVQLTAYTVPLHIREEFVLP